MSSAWVELKRKNRETVETASSSYTDINFSSWAPGMKWYWFKIARLERWMIHDVKSVIHNGKSYWGLGALITIGIDTLSKFRYGYSEKPDIERNSFQKFLEVYISPKFKKTIKTPFRKPNLKGLGSWFYKPSNLKYSEIFFFGFRNYLVHRFCFRYNFLIDPQDHFLRWKPQKLILSIDARRLLVNFEDGVRKYMRVMEKSNVGNEIYDNFFKMFSGTFEVY